MGFVDRAHYWHKSNKMNVFRFIVVAVACGLLALTSVGLRNRLVFGERLWTRSSFGMALLLSNHQFAKGGFEYNCPAHLVAAKGSRNGQP
jgi:hypothetical protein